MPLDNDKWEACGYTFEKKTGDFVTVTAMSEDVPSYLWSKYESDAFEQPCVVTLDVESYVSRRMDRLDGMIEKRLRNMSAWIVFAVIASTMVTAATLSIRSEPPQCDRDVAR